MPCKWCGKDPTRTTARYCNVCSAPLIENIPLAMQNGMAQGNFMSGAMLNGRYQIRKLLGSGGMGTVYGALDSNLPGKRVAVKELDPQKSGNLDEQQAAVKLFYDEAGMLARLDHPHLPKVTHFFGEGGRYYQILDFIDGWTLQEIQERQRVVPEAQVVDWARQICDALNYLHAQNPPVIFRDLKPGNVMLDKNGNIKLIDFGIARRFKVGQAHDTTMLGTPGYAAPEQYGKGQTDPRSDLYSLAATMYTLVSGYDVSLAPFQLPPVQTYAPFVSPTTARIINTGLAMDPSQRWQSAKQVSAMLPGMAIPVGGTMPVGGAPGGGTATKSITQLLGARIAELNNAQLVTLLIGLTAIAALATYVLTPILQPIPLFWNNVDASAIIAPLAYAATRKRGVAGIALGAIAGIGGIITQMQTSTTQYGALSMLAALVVAALAGGFAEVWLRALDPKKKSEDVWQREIAWLALMSAITVAIVRLPYIAVYGLQLAQPFVSALLGALGWFSGDLVWQTIQTRFQRLGHL